MGTKNLNSATNLITFTRASGGTALRKISYGNELVTNGTFDTDLSGWNNIGSHWTYSNGKAALLSTSPANAKLVSPTAYVEAGKTYRVRFDASSSTGSGNTRLKFRIWGNDNGTGTFIYNGAYIYPGSHEIFLVPTANGYASFDNVIQTINVDKFIDNVSIKEVLFDQADGTLQLWNHGNNVPRIEYDATGAVKGLLIEEARTNTISTSEVAPTAYSGGITKSVDSSVVSPAGGNNVEKFTLSSVNAQHYFGNHNPISASSGYFNLLNLC